MMREGNKKDAYHIQSLLVAGATGLIGREVVRQLLSLYPEIELHVLVRKQVPDFPEAVIQHQGSLEDFDGWVQGISCDAVICCVGSTLKKAGTIEKFREADVDFPIRLAKLSRFWAKSFAVISSAGAGGMMPGYYLKAKRDMERGLMQNMPPALHIFRPGLLDGNRSEVRKGELFALKIMRLLRFILPVRYRPVKAEWLAAALIRVVLSDQKGIFIYESEDIAPLSKGLKVKKNRYGLGI